MLIQTVKNMALGKLEKVLSSFKFTFFFSLPLGEKKIVPDPFIGLRN